MGKIGDLFVRLGLKSDDFKKGMSDAKKETEGFGGTLGKIKGVAVAAWAAAGAAVMKVARDAISASNMMSDAWDQKVSSMKASYQSMISEITAKSSQKKGWFLRLFNLSDPSAGMKMGANAKAAGDAAAEMTKAFDAQFELTNSVKLQRAAIQQELNELYVAMRDTTLSATDRTAAANKYKALLQPIADAEVSVYGNMLEAAVKAWQAGMDLDRTYSTAEMTEFFSKIGTEYDKMAQKFPDLMRVYETRKSDTQNQPIFDVIAAYQQAANQMSDIDRQLSRTTNSIKAEVQRSLEGIAEAVKQYGQEPLNLDLKLDISVDAEMAELDAEITEQISAQWDSLYNDLSAQYAQVEQMNGMLEQSFVNSFANGMQALAEFALGVEDTDMTQILAAFIQPLADTMAAMGALFITEGLAMVAFKNSLSNPYAAIAAGAALIATSALVTAGLAMLTSNPSGKGGTASSTSSSGSSSSPEAGKYEQDITVHVVGTISGSDIVLAGDRTLNKWSR